METAIIGLVGVALGSVISGAFQLLNSRLSAKKEAMQSLKVRLLDESLSLVDSAVDLLRSMEKLGGAVIPKGVDPESEMAQEIDSQGTHLADQLFYAFDQAERLAYRVEVVGGERSNEVAKEIKKNIDFYFRGLASKSYVFSAEEHRMEIEDLEKLLEDLIKAIKWDLENER